MGIKEEGREEIMCTKKIGGQGKTKPGGKGKVMSGKKGGKSAKGKKGRGKK